MSISGIGSYTNIISTYKTASKTTGASFQTELQKAQNTDTFTRTTPIDPSIAETQAKLDEVAAAGRAVDYSGMTKLEIYTEIENRYKEAFDDFFVAKSICLTKNQEMMWAQYDAEVEKFGIKNTFEFCNEARGYGDMSMDEIEATIKEKYANKTGYMNELNLVSELFASGVLSSKYGHSTAISMLSDIKTSMGCTSSKSNEEVFGNLDPNSSAFDMLMNNEYIPATHKEVYQRIIEDILFGIPDFVK